MKTKLFWLPLAVMLFGLAACNNDEPGVSPGPGPGDEPKFQHGTFVLNEGNPSEGNGSLVFIDRNGVVTENAYRGVNGTELGKVSEDLFISADGKMYIVSQNSGADGEYSSDGRLVVADASTLERQAAFDEELAGITMPTHVAALDAENVFIRHNGGVSLFNTVTAAAPVLIVGSEGADINRMTVVGGRVFAAAGNNVLVMEAFKTEVVDVFEMGAAVSAVVRSADGMLWVATTGEPQKIAKVNPSDGSVVKANEVSVGSLSKGWGASPGISAIGDVLYYCGGTTTIYRHDFATGSSVELLDAADFEPNASMIYNNVAVDPATGLVVMTTIKGYGTDYLVNNIMMFDVSGSEPDMVRNFADRTRFPAGVFFTAEF